MSRQSGLSRYQELRRYIEDVELGAAQRMGDLGTRLEAVENGLAAVRALLPGPPRIDPQFVAGRLGLTPAESRVAVALAEGDTVNDIAAATGRKVSTVRWYVGRIHRKLGVSTQAQLVRLVLLLPHGANPGDRPAS